MSNDVRALVEDRHAHPDVETAHALSQMTSSGQTLQGYMAMNGGAGEAEIMELAYSYYLDRQKNGKEGSAEEDWFRAENEIRDRQTRQS
jgi:hypothetical protein